jgi:single-strand DNA-binding protein
MAKAKNEVKLIGRVSGGPKIKRLPSGDEVVEIRLVVERDNVDGVDTLDIATWSSRLRRRTLSLKDQEWISVSGVIRRRFWRSGEKLASRWQVEARELKRV